MYVYLYIEGTKSLNPKCEKKGPTLLCVPHKNLIPLLFVAMLACIPHPHFVFVVFP